MRGRCGYVLRGLLVLLLVLNLAVLVAVLYVYAILSMGSVKGSLTIVFNAYVRVEDGKLVLSTPSIALLVGGHDKRIERYEYGVHVVAYVLRNDSKHMLLDTVIHRSTLEAFDVYGSGGSDGLRLVDLGSINESICGDRCYVVVDLYVTKLWMDLGFGKSISWPFTFWPWNPCTIVIPITRTGNGYEADLGNARIHVHGVENGSYVYGNEACCLAIVYPSKRFATYMINEVEYVPHSVVRTVEYFVRIALPLTAIVLVLDVLAISLLLSSRHALQRAKHRESNTSSTTKL